ncbi:hypothetical protein BDQ17DRAFT_1338643 [Cyathus striatus]|nr:hypothetical protein BDQ17DRAFT_1338643 [Cyathus striatus]
MNDMLGVCRQHSHRTAIQLVNEDDVKELFWCLDGKRVYYAGEATVADVEWGITINGHHITPDIIMGQLKYEGHSADHIQSIFNPDDKQNVKLAYNLLHDVWSLPHSTDHTNPGFLENCEALWIFGKFLYHLVFPYLCIDLLLSEKIEYLSATAHLGLALYKKDGKEFLPTNLYTDIMLMIKNVVFCVAKSIVNNPDSEYWITLLRTNQLEQMFGILQTMVGNDANLNILQLVSQLAGTTEVSNIIVKCPHWDREIPEHADHIKPGLWRGNVKLMDVLLQTSWRHGRNMVEEDCEFIKPILNQLEVDGANILLPFGILLVSTYCNHSNEDESLEASIPEVIPTVSSVDADMHIEVEDQFLEFTDSITLKPSISWYTGSKAVTTHTPLENNENVLIVVDPIGTLLYSNDHLWLCIAEVIGLQVDGDLVECIGLDMLNKETVSVSYQMLGLCQMTSDDNPELIHDWRTYWTEEHCYTVPG